MTGNRKENGTRFDISNINGDHVLLKSIFYNGNIHKKRKLQMRFFLYHGLIIRIRWLSFCRLPHVEK